MATVSSMTFFHTSKPQFRDAIAAQGLVPRVGDCYEAHYEDDDTPAEALRPAVFLARGRDAVFESTYDDDLWMVDTRGLLLQREEDGVDWFLCFESIPPSRLRLVYRGSGMCLLGGRVGRWKPAALAEAPQ